MKKKQIREIPRDHQKKQENKREQKNLQSQTDKKSIASQANHKEFDKFCVKTEDQKKQDKYNLFVYKCNLFVYKYNLFV